MVAVNAKQMTNQCKEFDRQIKELKRAAAYALTLDDKLDLINQTKTLQTQRLNFRRKWIVENFEKSC